PESGYQEEALLVDGALANIALG
ncbi:hypothetical protein A2U01_0097634, partial [Trifolium medium]|nr:hypothetical protein [Trifolium medium]